MSISIKYKNESDNFITFQQTANLEVYVKAIYDNGILTTEEEFVDGEIRTVRVHNINNSSHSSLLSNFYSSGNSDLEFCIIDHISYSNGYRLEKLSSYENASGSLLGKVNRLFDMNNRLVGVEMFLGANNTPEYKSTYKFYYDQSINPERELFSCRYDDGNGAFESFDFNQEHTDRFGHDSFSLLNNPADILELKNITGMSQALVDYYLSAAVIPTNF
jgi:hypothetical protein